MDDVALFEELAPTREALLDVIGQVVVGQRRVIDLMLTALLSDGHALFIGVPGLAKTLLVRTVADTVGVSFGRIQFTPDLMPSDITGTEVLEEDRTTGRRALRFVKGPVFTNLLLADEINRTPPKTQAALLQAMQERSVTASGHTHKLEPPFLVFATQNPIEQEGTYPLPEAQQDRFMFSIRVDYPDTKEEEEIVRRTTVGEMPTAHQVLDGERLLQFQQVLRRLPANGDVVSYCVRLAQATRPGSGFPSTQWIRWGAGPRASQYLAIGARTWAALHGNEVPTREDVRKVAESVLQHRIVLNFEAEASGLDAAKVVRQLLEEVG
ncbi:MAG: MoxR family ATPase [Deltaproteobacteria bacterium]|nr:MoxR family ATPase [Deltaproteobacteria bacterium]MBW2254726.1 MoxR family ATPase [Deltaproteobacteria bacterium]